MHTFKRVLNGGRGTEIEIRMQFTSVDIVKAKPGRMDETLRKAETELLPLYRQSPGFVAYTIALTDEVSATALSIWQTRQQAEHARQIREDWERKEQTATSIDSIQTAVGSLPFLAITRNLVGYTSVIPAALAHHY
jgi:hypothetical protein